MSGEGMVAVVQSLRDARLAVTLVDGSQNKFSLVPNAVETELQTQRPKYQTIHLRPRHSSGGTDPTTIRCDSSAQATDGRYASMYQTTHGKIEPTSPPCEVTEFPPQRAELSPGRGNFEVGGLGSGETGRVPIKPNQGNYRGGMCWPDRGSVCLARGSQQADAFANSLRKYPPTSPERSSEVLERLVTYSQAKNLSRHPNKVASPTRTPIESDVSNHTYCERSPRRTRWDEMRSRTRADEYPTREGRPRKEEFERRNYSRNYEIRFARDPTRAKDNGKMNEFSYQYNVRDDSHLPSYQRKHMSTNSVHTETQAAVTMCSKEVATVPRSSPVKKNVAVPQSTSTSTVGRPEGVVSDIPSTSQMEQNATKIISFKSVQTTSSSTELTSALKNLNPRKSKSEDDLKRQHFQEGIIELIETSPLPDENGQYFRVVKSTLENSGNDNNKGRESFNKSIQTLYYDKENKVRTNVHKPDDEKKIKKSLKKCLQLVSNHLTEHDEDTKKFKEDLTKTLLKKLTKTYLNTKSSRIVPPVKIYRLEIPRYVIYENIDELRTRIEDWLKVIPIKRRNALGIATEYKEIVECLIKKIKPIILNKYQCKESYRHDIKTQILEVLEDLPVVSKRNDKNNSLNRYANMLTEDILNMNTDLKNKYEIDDIDIDIYVRDEILKFLEKVNLCYSKEIKDSERYLVKILKKSLSLKTYENGHLKEDLSSVLQNVGKWPVHQADYFVNILMRHFNKCFLSNNNDNNIEDEINTLSYFNPSGSESLHCYEYHQISTNYNDINNMKSQYIDISYKDQLTKVVADWLADIDLQIPTINKHKIHKERVVTGLVDDIICRSKLFSKTKDQDNERHLINQIYEWFSNEFGNDYVDYENISELINEIRDLSVTKYRNNILIYPSSVQQISSRNRSETAIQNSTLPYDERLVEEIYGWLHDLPANMHSSQDASLETQLIKDLASNIEKGMELKKGRSKVIDSQVNDWIKKALAVKPKESVTNKLKKRIKNIPYVKSIPIDYKLETKSIRQYEDVIDDWLNTIPLDPRKDSEFIKIRLDSVHELAKKIYKMKNKGSTDSDNIATKILENVVSDWLKKIPIHPRGDRKAFRDQHAAKLIKKIQDCNQQYNNNDESAIGVEKLTDIELNSDSLQAAALGWLNKSSLYQDSNLNSKRKQEKCINEFAKEYTQAAHTGEGTEAVITKYVRMLYQDTNTEDEFIQNQCLQLKYYLQSNIAPDLSKSLKRDGEILYENALRKSPPTSTEIIHSAILNWSSTLPFKKEYCPRDFMSLVDQMAKDVTSLIVHPEHSLDEENEEQMKQKIFEYVQNFPLKSGINIEQICDMITDLWSILKDIHLYRDDNGSNDRSQSDSMFRNNVQSFPNRNGGLTDINNRQQQINTSTSNLPEVISSAGLGGRSNIITDGEGGRRLSAPIAATSLKERIRGHSAPSAVTTNNTTNNKKSAFHGMTTEHVYEKCNVFFEQVCREIPFDISTDENKVMADMARQVLRNGIWKAYFALKSDEEVADNYAYFKYLMEERLAQMLDVILPQSNEMLKFKATFLNDVVNVVVNMLKAIHENTDPPFTKNLIRNKLDRRTARQEYNEFQDYKKHLLIQDIINEHLLYINYKETDTIKANIYRKRLAKLINELINYIRTLNTTQPQYINEIAMRLYINDTLRNMPAIDNEILKEEVNEILLAQEIEQWFKNLPTIPVSTFENEDEFRRRRCEVLAHKIHEIERKRIDPEDSHCEREVRHEISNFLCNKKTNLNQDEDLNINLMVQELANRLKKLRDDKITEYESFSKEKPASSSLTQIDPEDVIVPSIENDSQKSVISPALQNQVNDSIRNSINKSSPQIGRPGVLGTSQLAGPSRYMFHPNYHPEVISGIAQTPVKNIVTLNSAQDQNNNIILPNDHNSLGQDSNSIPLTDVPSHRSLIPTEPFDQSNHIILSESIQPQIENPPLNQSGQLLQSPGLQSNVIPLQQSQYLRPPVQEGQGSHTDQGPGASRGTASTARVTTDQRNNNENQETDREVRYRCRCLERIWRCRKRFRPFIMYPMPFPCRYFDE